MSRRALLQTLRQLKWVFQKNSLYCVCFYIYSDWVDMTGRRKENRHEGGCCQSFKRPAPAHGNLEARSRAALGFLQKLDEVSVVLLLGGK